MGSSADNTGSVDKLGNGRANRARNVPPGNPVPETVSDDGSGQGVGELAALETDQRAGVELGESKIARAITWNPNDDIDMRLFWAMADVEKLEKDLDVEFGSTKYKGISAGQVVAVAKKVLIQNGIKFTPITMQDDVRRNGNKTEIWIIGRFACVDNKNDFVDRGTWGEGNDNAAHGYQKATTNAEKIILKSVLQMTTEGDEAEPIETRTEASDNRVKEAEALSENAIKSWADNFKRALNGCQTQKELKQVRAENAHMMKNESVPEVTRTYFIDTIAQMESDLP